MNHIQHFGAGAFVALFGVFGMSAIDLNAQYFSIENGNAIYSQAAAAALADAAKSTQGSRPINNFTPSTRIDLQKRDAHIRGTIVSIGKEEFVVKTNNGEWKVRMTNDTKYPFAHGGAVTVKQVVEAKPEKADVESKNVPALPVLSDTAMFTPRGSETQFAVGDKIDAVGRLIGSRTVRATIVRNIDIRPIPMPLPIAPVDGDKIVAQPVPGVAQPVPLPRD